MPGDAPDLKLHIDLGFTPFASGVLRRVGGKGTRGAVVHVGESTWRATRTVAGSATLQLTATDHGVDINGWGPGADAAAALVPDLLGAADDPSALVVKDSLVDRLVRTTPHYRMTRTHTIWEHLIDTILGQKVPVASAAGSWQAMLRRWGEQPPGPAPGPLRLGPHPDVLAGLAYHDLHLANVERKRAEIILTAARRWKRLEEALYMTPPEARRRLEALRGIGPWTSSIVTQLAFGDPDAVIIGDYNIPSTVAWNFVRERTADDARMLELLQPYEGQRARVQNLLKFGGEKPPRHGPKLSVTDLSGR